MLHDHVVPVSLRFTYSHTSAISKAQWNFFFYHLGFWCLAFDETS